VERLEMKINILKKVSGFLTAFLTIIQQFTPKDDIKYKIVEIDMGNQSVLFRVCGSSATMKHYITEAISDNLLLSGLSPIDACLIGLCYGKLLKRSIDRGYKLIKNPFSGYQLSAYKGQYKILSLDRNGEITYIDSKTQFTHSKLPTDLVQNDDLIRDFDPSQASYIGTLAGISKSSKIAIIEPKVSIQKASVCKEPKLRLVK
jgi:hypothetical protein